MIMTDLDPKAALAAAAETIPQTAPLHLPDDPECGTYQTCAYADQILREVASEATGVLPTVAPATTVTTSNCYITAYPYGRLLEEPTCSYCC